MAETVSSRARRRQENSSRPYLRRLLIKLGIVLSCIVAFPFLLRFAVSGTPYQMNLRVVDGTTMLHFVQPDPKLVSPEFPVDLKIDSSKSISLTTTPLPIPGCEVEFVDVTFLPGRFTIRIGDHVYDVMGSRINVDGKDYDWQSR